MIVMGDGATQREDVVKEGKLKFPQKNEFLYS
jgi:hypothetical protein